MSSKLSLPVTFTRYSGDWSAVRLSEWVAGSDCLPVPPPKELARAATCAQETGYIEVGSSDTAPRMPVVVRSRRAHGAQFRLVESPGTDLYDYQGLSEALNTTASVDALRGFCRTERIDALAFSQVVGPVPSHLEAYKRSYCTAWFDASRDVAHWAGLYGRKSIKRHTNKLTKEVGARTVTLTECEELERWLPVLREMHKERWRFDGVDSAFNDPHRMDQYHAMMERSCLTLVLHGDSPVAMHWGFVFGQTLLWHTPLINIKYIEYSPLEILLGAVAKYCEGKGLQALDFGLGDESYKMRFANAVRDVADIFVPVSLKARLVHFAMGYIEPKHVRDAVSHAKDRLRSARLRLRRTWASVHYFTALPSNSGGDVESTGSFIQISDWQELVDIFRRSGLKINRYQYERMKAGERLACLCIAGQIVSMGWCHAGDTEFVVGETGAELHLPGSMILYDFVTRPEMRNRGHYTALLKCIIAHFADVRLVIYASVTNAPSIRAIERAGFVRTRLALLRAAVSSGTGA